MISLREYLLEKSSVPSTKTANQIGNPAKGKNSKKNNSYPSNQNNSSVKQTKRDNDNIDLEKLMNDTKDSTTKQSNNIELWDVRD